MLTFFEKYAIIDIHTKRMKTLYQKNREPDDADIRLPFW